MKQFSLFKQDKKSYAVLLFFSALIVDLLSAVFGFGGAQFIFHFSDYINIDMFLSFESLVVSVLVICLNLLIIIYSYSNNQPNKLKALGCANLIMSLIPFVFNSVYYPFSYLIIEAITDLANISNSFHFSEFRFYIAEFISLPMCISCFAFLSKLKKVSEDKVRKDISISKLSFIIIAIFVFVSILALYICNTPISEDFNYSVFEYLIKS